MFFSLYTITAKEAALSSIIIGSQPCSGRTEQPLSLFSPLPLPHPHFRTAPSNSALDRYARVAPCVTPVETERVCAFKSWEGNHTRTNHQRHLLLSLRTQTHTHFTRTREWTHTNTGEQTPSKPEEKLRWQEEKAVSKHALNS